MYTDPYKNGSKHGQYQHGDVPASGVFHDKAYLFGIFDHFNQLDPISMVHLLHDCISVKRMLRFTASCRNKIDDRIHTLFAFVLTDHLPSPAWS